MCVCVEGGFFFNIDGTTGTPGRDARRICKTKGTVHTVARNHLKHRSTSNITYPNLETITLPLFESNTNINLDPHPTSPNLSISSPCVSPCTLILSPHLRDNPRHVCHPHIYFHQPHTRARAHIPPPPFPHVFPNPHLDDNICTCDNGAPKTGTACTKHGAAMCKGCNAGFTINKDKTKCDGM